VPGASDYISALSAYFTVSPYRSWFDFYEHALNGLGASYYGAADATALHTDIGSCLATSPSWSDLPGLVKERLAVDGISMWHRLAVHLRPDVILWSTARQWLDVIEFEPLTQWRPARRSTVRSACSTPQESAPVVETCWRQRKVNPLSPMASVI
jgi:hypothetical protein